MLSEVCIEVYPSEVDPEYICIQKHARTHTQKCIHTARSDRVVLLPFAGLWVWVGVVYGDAAALFQSALTR